jgi:hypothetical protein
LVFQGFGLFTKTYWTVFLGKWIFFRFFFSLLDLDDHLINQLLLQNYYDKELETMADFLFFYLAVITGGQRKATASQCVVLRRSAM